jgi:uncharacterized protein
MTMGASENKQVVMDFFSHSSAGRQQEAFNLLAEDATWWAPGVGTMTKRNFAAVMTHMGTIMKGPIKITPKRMTAEDDRVAMEAESDGDVVNGKHYHNTYHFLIVVRAGKIHEVKEYNDTKYAADVFGDLIPSANRG